MAIRVLIVNILRFLTFFHETKSAIFDIIAKKHFAIFDIFSQIKSAIFDKSCIFAAN